MVLPLRMACGDDAIEGEIINNSFKEHMQEFTSRFFEEKLLSKDVYEEYTQFYNERKKYLLIPALKENIIKAKDALDAFKKDVGKFDGKKTVVIALEDILLTMETQPMDNYDLELDAKEGHVTLGKVYVKFRPFLFDFLEFAASRFELIVSCTSSGSYCASILDSIERHKKYFAHRIDKCHVLLENPCYTIKDYSFLLTEGRTIDNIIIVDHSVAGFCFEMNNGVIVKKIDPASSTDNDKELIGLARYLEVLDSQASVNKYIKEILIKSEQ